MATIDLRSDTGQQCATSWIEGTRLHWRGHRLEIVDVAPLAPDHTQLVLRYLDRKGVPLSVSASDLSDAVTVR
jgi:hypothetical protein